MIDRYKGESLGKKMARLMFWTSVRRWQRERFYNGRHLVLASREGGDVGVLIAMGVDPSMILAIDLNREAAEACKARWSSHGVHVIHGDAIAIARKKASSLASAFFDFCGRLEGAQVTSLTSVAREMRSGSVLAVAGMRGRERNIVMKRYAQKTRERIELGQSILESRGEERDPVLEMFDVTRVRAFQTHLMNSLMGARVAPITVSILNYQSNTPKSKGVPMTIGAFGLVKGTHLSVIEFKRRATRLEYMTTMGLQSDSSMFMAGDYGFTERKRFLEAVIRLRSAPSRDVALMFNIPLRTVAAIRAHGTRGTYGESIQATPSDEDAYREGWRINFGPHESFSTCL